MTQTQTILDHLRRYGSITPIAALRDLGCFRLAARINELRADGHKISTEFANGNGGKKYARYVYQAGPVQSELF